MNKFEHILKKVAHKHFFSLQIVFLSDVPVLKQHGSTFTQAATQTIRRSFMLLSDLPFAQSSPLLPTRLPHYRLPFFQCLT